VSEPAAPDGSAHSTSLKVGIGGAVLAAASTLIPNLSAPVQLALIITFGVLAITWIFCSAIVKRGTSAASTGASLGSGLVSVAPSLPALARALASLAPGAPAAAPKPAAPPPRDPLEPPCPMP
jgi:hypothetical protein